MKQSHKPNEMPAKVLIEPTETVLEEALIQDRVCGLASTLQQELADRDVTAIVVMTGAMFFAADLIRQIRGNHHRVLRSLQLRTVWTKSYEGTESGKFHFSPVGLEQNHVKGRHVLIIDDILDTGQTLHCIQEHVEAMEPDSVRTVVLLRKMGRELKSHPVKIEEHHIGFDIGDHFVVGYGLDWNEMYRELPYIRQFDPRDQI